MCSLKKIDDCIKEFEGSDLNIQFTLNGILSSSSSFNLDGNKFRNNYLGSVKSNKLFYVHFKNISARDEFKF